MNNNITIHSFFFTMASENTTKSDLLSLSSSSSSSSISLSSSFSNLTLDKSIPVDLPLASVVLFTPDGQNHGCSHYKKHCLIKAPCCDKYYCCRFCHDAAEEKHEINRHEIDRMICMYCASHSSNPRIASQPVSSTCIDCNQSLAKYYCSICKFFDDEPDRPLFHCKGCGICRRGHRDQFFHCEKCACCFNIEFKTTHQCIEKVLDNNCPICLIALFTSTIPIHFLRCGHPIHLSCLESHCTHSNTSIITCPSCRKSILDDPIRDQAIIEYLSRNKMPIEYESWISMIKCNDCSKTSQVPFHFSFHRCLNCQSFNTDLIHKGFNQQRADKLNEQRLISQEEQKQ